MTTNRTVLLTLAAAALVACDQVPSNALQSCEASQVFGGHVRTDILFVIDDSGSMAYNQERLRLALSRFIGRLATSPIVDDFRIGVTNTSVSNFGGGTHYTDGPNATAVPYPAGALIAVDPTSLVLTDTLTWGKYFWTSSASAPGPGFYGPRSQTYAYMSRGDATLVSDFQTNVLVGTFGAWREQPFEAMRLALTTQLETGGENVGFVRPGARLAIIFLSDEDDCSGDSSIGDDATCRSQRYASNSHLTPVSDYVSLLQGPIDGEVKDVVVAAIAAVTCENGVCTNTMCPTGYTGGEPPATRYLELLDAFPSTSTALASICDSNFDAALDRFADAVMSQTLPLEGEVADPHLLVVTLERFGGEVVSCSVAKVGDADVAAAGAVYTPAQGGAPATLTFRGSCTLAPGDRIDIKVICAG